MELRRIAARPGPVNLAAPKPLSNLGNHPFMNLSYSSTSSFDPMASGQRER